MPNHFHGIISIKKTTTSPQNISQHWQSGCLGAIINQFKSICTKKIRKFYPDFQWQTRYYDHIIRDENELFFISEYIINNPKEWGNDKFFP
jgi:REP element-mobilizing transposase RayT